MASIYHPVNGEHSVFFPHIINVQLAAIPQLTDELITEAHLLCIQQNRQVIGICKQLLLHLHNVNDGFQEVSGDLGHIKDRRNAFAATEQFGNSKDVVILKLCDVVVEFLGGHIIKLCFVEMVCSHFQRANRLQKTLFQIGANAHNFTGSLHLGT